MSDIKLYRNSGSFVYLYADLAALYAGSRMKEKITMNAEFERHIISNAFVNKISFYWTAPINIPVSLGFLVLH